MTIRQIARDSCTVFLNEVKKHTDYWGSVYYPGIWSIELAMALGWLVGALPSGRMASEALTEGVAPSRGWDRKGPTAAVKSVAKLDHDLMENGCIFNIKFSPVMFKDNNIDKFIAVLKTYLDLGGFQMQVAVVDKQTLLDARKNPRNIEISSSESPAIALLHRTEPAGATTHYRSNRTCLTQAETFDLFKERILKKKRALKVWPLPIE